MADIMMPAQDRVRNSTADSINKKIDKKILDNVRQYSSGEKGSIKKRINELDKEWDIERTLELNASVVALTGVILAAAVNKKWLILPGIVTFFWHSMPCRDGARPCPCSVNWVFVLRKK